MKYIWKCRRTGIAFLAIVSLSVVMAVKGIDTSTAIASIAIGLAGANSFEKRGSNKGPGKE